MSIERSHTGVILSENPKQDLLFKSFLRNCSLFTIVQQIRPGDLLDGTHSCEVYDYIFFSEDLPESLLGTIKTYIKSNPAFQPKPRIILFTFKDNIPRQKLTRSLLAGANAFMVSPFNLQSLSDACDFKQKIHPNDASEARLKIAVKMMIEDSVDASETPSMIHKIPTETKEYFKELGKSSLSSNLIDFFSPLSHTKRIGSYEPLRLKVTKLIKERIKSHLNSNK